MPFPQIDPVAFALGPISVRWYGLAYVVGISLGWIYARSLVRTAHLWRDNVPALTVRDLDDFVVWAAAGIVIGGRLGYVIFYDFDNTIANPLGALKVWNGGMSFHGGLTGTAIAMVLFAGRRGISAWSLFDVIATVSGVGLFLVRIANFINGELWGKVTSLPWGVVFPDAGPLPRHPSQLYEAGLEGLLIGLVTATLALRYGAFKRPGLVSGVFVCLDAICRILVEFVRVPDPQLGYLANGWLTMGMILSVPLLLLGACLIWRPLRRSY